MGEHLHCQTCEGRGFLINAASDLIADARTEPCPDCEDCGECEVETLPFERDDEALLAEADAIDRNILERDLSAAFDFGGES